MRPSLLHVTNGDSAGNTLRRTALGGAVLLWQDALHERPAPAAPRGELELLGLERWIGGTHLTGEPVWRWDTGTRRVVPG